MSNSSESTSVLVVGGGPTGLLASILLSKYEIPHVLVEQRSHTLNAPAAHVVNTRTMEIYRQAGLNVGELYALNTHPRAGLVSWKDRLENRPIGVFDMAGNREALMAQTQFSGEHTTNISQHRLEAYLLRHAGASEFADIRFGTRWSRFTSDDKRSSQLQRQDGETLEVAYDFMLAADGAGSSVSRALGIRKVGPDAIATFLNLTCEVDIAKVTGEDSSLLYWLLDPDVQGTVIVHDPHELSVYMRPIAVPYESVDDYDDARCEKLLKAVFGDQPYRIRHKGVWKMTAQVAEKFRDGPVFLVGDSIHRFPPTGGLGLNTGAGDVHNLVWKLGAALAADMNEVRVQDLLDSYELERRPVAQRNCDVSKHNNDKMIEVIEALGLDPSKAGMLAQVMNSWIVKRLPAGIQASLYGLLTSPVRKILRDALADDAQGQSIRKRVANAIANQREHFSSIGLDLGYVYREGCAVSEAAAETPGSEVTTYTETIGAGARLPHREQTSDAGGRLHDLLDYRSFTLFGEPPTAIPDTFGVEVKHARLDAADGLATERWVLVRPDGHVMAAGP